MRVACLAVPLFPLAARLRSEPELLAEAVAVVAGNGPTARVVVASRRARQRGLRPGATLPQARALLPHLLTRPRDPECERAAQEALLEVAERFSPRVEDGGEGEVYLEVSGCEHHFRDEHPEAALARALLAAAQREGLPARAGVAGSKLAARVAAGLTPSPRIVPPGEEALFLAPLPLSRLTPELELAETLHRWGIGSIGELARLPAAEVASRLGEAGQQLHARARGLDPQPLVARVPPPDFREGMSLEWPLTSLEPFLFLARTSLGRLCRRLDGQGLGCARLEVSLRLEPDGFCERSITLPAPSRDVKTLLTLVRLDLERDPPGAPVGGFTFAARPDRPRGSQLTLFGPREVPPDRLATTLARLFALLGPERAGTPAVPDGHRPERFALVEFAPPPPPRERPAPAAGRGLLQVRVLRPPVPLEVLVEAGRDGAETPVEVRPAPGEEAGRLAIDGRVRVASGPWELEEGWWRGEPVAREYWDVELEGSGIYRIYRDRERGDWFADGVYD
ncbi:MAG TPA: DNA polymerase Y family protein [Thermoanaerobaculia bacterium]|nr:DNA polymerase Y family protein [Thermoanaerobaculia bacterium]